MRNNIVTLLLILIFLTACGAQANKNNTQISDVTPITSSANSVESIDTAIEKEGFTLDTFNNDSQEIQKLSPSNVQIVYSSTQEVNISSHRLYSVTNEENQSIIVTIDETLLDNIENNSYFVMHHTLPVIPYGFTNLNTTLTDINSTITSILEEIENAFQQKTINNPSTKRVNYTVVNDSNETVSDVIDDENTTRDFNITTNEVTTETLIQKQLSSSSTQQVSYRVTDDVNVSYQTALKNHDETFDCNLASKIIDAQKGYTILKNLSIGSVECFFGLKNVPIVDFNITLNDTTPPLITLNGESNITITIGKGYTELGATAIDDVDGNISVVISGSVNTSTLGTYLITYSATDKTGNFSKKSREIQVHDSESATPTPITEEVSTEGVEQE